MADLATDWLGLQLRSPLVVGASPLADDRRRRAASRRRGRRRGRDALAVRGADRRRATRRPPLHRHATSTPTPKPAPSCPTPTCSPSVRPRRCVTLEALRAALDVPVVASLNGTTPGGWTDLARQLGDAGADALELNLYEVATRSTRRAPTSRRASSRSSPRSSTPSAFPSP